MFGFALSDEEEMIRSTAETFARSELLPKVRDHEAAQTLPAHLWKKFDDTGLGLAGVPETAGGAGLGAFADTLVYYELSRADAGAAFALGLSGLGLRIFSLNTGPVHLVSDIDQRLEAAGGSVSGKWPLSFGRETGRALVLLSGSDSALFVETGVSATPCRPAALDTAQGWTLSFDKAPVKKTVPAAAFQNHTRQLAATLLAGLSACALEYARTYTMERKTFGRTLAHHQGVAFVLAEMAMRTEASRLAVWRSAWRMDSGKEARFDTAAAFVEAAQNTLFVCDQALQLLGGHGYMKDHLVEKYFREARVLSQLWGGVDGALMTAGAFSTSLSTEIGFPELAEGRAP